MFHKAKSSAGLGPAFVIATALFIGGAVAIARRTESSGAPIARSCERVVEVADRGPGATSPATTIVRTSPTRYADAVVQLRDWTERDPPGAWNWVRDHSAALTPFDEPSLIAVFFRHLAARDPDTVLAFADASLTRDDGSVIASAAINALLENNWPDLARRHVEQWANDPTAPAIGAAPFQAIAWQFARTSDRAAGDWLTRLPASAGRDAAFAGTAANWAEHDPQAAMAWAAELPAGNARANALDRAFRIWADHESAAAADWLLDHESRSEADRLIGVWLAASPAVAENPRVALQWVALIRDGTARRQGQDLVIAKWRERDASAADRFAASPP